MAAVKDFRNAGFFTFPYILHITLHHFFFRLTFSAGFGDTTHALAHFLIDSKLLRRYRTILTDIMKEHHSQKIIVILCHSQSDPVHCKHHRMNNIGPALGTFLSVMKPNGRLQCHSTLLHMMFFDVLPQILLHIRSFLVKL